MAITASHIRGTLDNYLDEHPEEKVALAAFIELLDSGALVTSRKEFRGHAVAGAVLVDDGGNTLLIRHVALDKWLYTIGGHLEDEDISLLDAARREIAEETGIDPEGITLVSEKPIHIEIHDYPHNDAKNEPAHQHVDFRYLFRTVGHQEIKLQQEEVSSYAWRNAETIEAPVLRARVLNAIR